ncbi:hypothetical protein EVAR_18700_1 [Eumeta japonica]|uniref:Uncharacterized protein n=1 Tax=Eumeta variegata TaxID=151549 RepID=A0A4C1U6W2_EUMVA|nr:hypothetical protein EVAR_18700_1 [Eumeta japonica]
MAKVLCSVMEFQIDLTAPPPDPKYRSYILFRTLPCVDTKSSYGSAGARRRKVAAIRFNDFSSRSRVTYGCNRKQYRKRGCRRESNLPGCGRRSGARGAGATKFLFPPGAPYRSAAQVLPRTPEPILFI